MYTTPQALIPAPGAGKAIAIEAVSTALTYASAAFATNTDLYINYDSSAGDGGGANALTAAIDAILLKTANEVSISRPQVDEVTLVQNKGISAKVGTGNPTAWGGTLKITIFYRIITL